MKLDFFSKRTKGSEIVIENEREVISAFFLKPLEALRFMSAYDAELKTTIQKKMSEKFEIAKRAAQDRIDKVLEAKFFSYEEDEKIYKNHKLFEWLQAYLLPLFPKKENGIIKRMLFNNSTNLDVTMIAKSKVYTQRIEDVLRKKFEPILSQKIVSNLVDIIWGVFEVNFMDYNLSYDTKVKLSNEKEVINALFKKPFEVMRILFDSEMELKNSVVKIVSEKFEITDQTAKRHLGKITKSGILLVGEKKKLFKNPTLVKWFWSYLMPFFKEREKNCLETMLFGASAKFTLSQLSDIEIYTEWIETKIRKEFEYVLEKKLLEKIVKTIRDVLREEKTKIDIFGYRKK